MRETKLINNGISFNLFHVPDCHLTPFSKISKERTSFYHIDEKYSVSSTFLYNGNLKCYVVRILYAISFQWSNANFSFVVQQITHKFKIQKVDKIEEKRQRNSYLSFRVT
jgi:hypothetical protein